MSQRHQSKTILSWNVGILQTRLWTLVSLADQIVSSDIRGSTFYTKICFIKYETTKTLPTAQSNHSLHCRYAMLLFHFSLYISDQNMVENKQDESERGTNGMVRRTVLSLLKSLKNFFFSRIAWLNERTLIF